ncbi:membrane protein insertion efficiency factor YidD [Candidatus Woesebacteria bacterium CG_4_10_14_0_2_um_filter_39_14]|uniref:Putative membrane protein insertion efficiency factor n=1 Tax=Candidatus Woesebacteria bacterium CG_4_10_14_0_2_um_filter_39_14 TaxID=1975054 RepID=A0A2M7TNG2_9BACT|nr:MAG: membrane protein insertion efficiency factor YidD [Candidatus Woesebacteria bacterium CG_4_10_14_0_2_um_filter_39_14]
MKSLFLKLIRFYQKTHFFHLPFFRLLFLSDSICRFQPTCAEYTYQAISHYGIMRGSWLGLKRICRCHPWSKGGYEPLPLLKNKI